MRNTHTKPKNVTVLSRLVEHSTDVSFCYTFQMRRQCGGMVRVVFSKHFVFYRSIGFYDFDKTRMYDVWVVCLFSGICRSIHGEISIYLDRFETKIFRNFLV